MTETTTAPMPCQDTHYTDLIGVACPECAHVFPNDHARGCKILWPFNGARMTTPKPEKPRIRVGHDGLCLCDCSVECPLGRIGSMPRCSAQELTAAGVEIEQRQFDRTRPDAEALAKSLGKTQAEHQPDARNPFAPGSGEHRAWEAGRASQQPKPSPIAAAVTDVKRFGDDGLHPDYSELGEECMEQSAYGDAPLDKTKSAELQSADTSLRALQARARIAQSLGEAAQAYGDIAPSQEEFDDFGRALGMLQEIAVNGKNVERDTPLAGQTRTASFQAQSTGPSVFLGRPFCGEVDDGAAAAAYSYPSINPQTPLRITLERQHSSALCYVFNRCWAAMFCHKGWPFDYFVLQHQDIEPLGPWLDIGIEELEKGGYDVMTALSPIKDDRGLTSTAYGCMELDWHVVRRITLREKDELLPETFGIKEIGEVLGFDGIPGTPCLLNNTGIMIIKVHPKRLTFNPENRIGPFCVGLPEDKRGMWPYCFPGWRMHDRMTWSEGFCKAEFISEDWDNGRWFARHGLNVGCTSRINLGHYGRTKFDNRWDKGQLHDETFFHRLKLHAEQSGEPYTEVRRTVKPYVKKAA